MEVRIDNQTKYIYSTSGSQSSIIKYNTGLQKLGLNLVYFTFPDSITAETYSGCLRAPFCRGGAVTAHDSLKSKIIPYLDVVDPLALQTKAVNTVIHNSVDDKLYGYNTDVFGLQNALKVGIEKYNLSTEIKTAVIYGNGGVSGVAWHVLKEILGANGQITIVGRNPERVLQKRIDLGIENVPHFEGPYDLVLDATPVASHENLPSTLLNLVKDCKAVFCHSMPEKDSKTNYLQNYCQENNVRYFPGSWMHGAQMIKQYSLYFNDGLNEQEKKVTENDIAKTWNLQLS